MIDSIKNLFASFLGRGLSILLSVLFNPFFIKKLGIEFYGLLGFFLTISTLLCLLELGLSTILIKEVSQEKLKNFFSAPFIQFIRSLEHFYWFGGIILFFALIIFSDFIAHDWLKSENFSPGVIKHCLLLIGVTILLQWPIPFYSGILFGLNKHVVFNIIICLVAILKNFGLFCLFHLLEPSWYLFFYFYAIIHLIQIVILYALSHKFISFPTFKFQNDFSYLKRIRGLITGVMGISLTAVLITQVDKLVLSKIINLKKFGYYSIASTFAFGLNIVAGAFFQTFLPRLSEISAKSDNTLSEEYHNASQLLSFFILPLGFVMAIYSQPILFFWIKDREIASNSALSMTLLTIGTMLNALMMIPYTLQMAQAMTRNLLIQNLFSLCFYIPLTIFLTKNLGAIGAAISMILLNLGYLIVNINLMHKKILKNQKGKWYLNTIITPSFFLLIFLILTKIYLPFFESSIYTLIVLLIICFCIAGLFLKPVREFVVLGNLKKIGVKRFP